MQKQSFFFRNVKAEISEREKLQSKFWYVFAVLKKNIAEEDIPSLVKVEWK